VSALTRLGRLLLDSEAETKMYYPMGDVSGQQPSCMDMQWAAAATSCFTGNQTECDRVLATWGAGWRDVPWCITCDAAKMAGLPSCQVPYCWDPSATARLAYFKTYPRFDGPNALLNAMGYAAARAGVLVKWQETPLCNAEAAPKFSQAQNLYSGEVAPEPPAPTDVDPPSDTDSSESGLSGMAIAGILAALVLVGGGIYLATRKK
jgi:hypothetical protein